MNRDFKYLQTRVDFDVKHLHDGRETKLFPLQNLFPYWKTKVPYAALTFIFWKQCAVTSVTGWTAA